MPDQPDTIDVTFAGGPHAGTTLGLATPLPRVLQVGDPEQPIADGAYVLDPTGDGRTYSWTLGLVLDVEPADEPSEPAEHTRPAQDGTAHTRPRNARKARR